MSTDPTEVVLARIETKLDVVIVAKDDHESRLRSLEKRMWALAGAGAVIGTGGGALLAKIVGA